MMAIVKQQWRRGNINRENRLFPFCYVIEDDKNILFYSVLERCSQKYILPLIYEEVFINYNNLTYPAICIASTKPVEWVVVYMRVRGIDFASASKIILSDFGPDFWWCGIKDYPIGLWTWLFWWCGIKDYPIGLWTLDLTLLMMWYFLLFYFIS